MNKFLVFSIVFIIILTGVVVWADYQSRETVNTWYWEPGTGNPQSYIVEKSTDGGQTWKVVDTVPHVLREHQSRMVVLYTHVSSGDESYQLRVKAVDAAGNQSPYSEVSDILHVTDTTRPGRPKILEK